MKLTRILLTVVVSLTMISCSGRVNGQLVRGDTEVDTVPVKTESSSNPDSADNEADPQDIEEIVSGLYSWGFEVSDLEPCGVDEKWWLVGSAPELLSRYRALISNVYEQVYARLKGIKSAPGRYGHLGAYDRQFEVHEILELRVLQDGDCE